MPAQRPLLLMATSAICFGLMAFAAKLAAERLSGSEIAFLRFAFMLLPLLLVPRFAREAVEFQRLDLLLYRGIFGGTAVLLYFLAISHIPVGLATLLNYSAPVFSVPFAALFLGERVDRRLVYPLSAALIGMVLAAGGGHTAGELLHFTVWELAGMGSAVLSGAAVTAIRAARRTEGSWAIYGSFSLFGLIATAPFALPGFQPPTGREWLLLAAVGGFSVIAQLLMTWAYRWVTNLQAGILQQLAVVLTLILGVVFLEDRLTPVQILGCLLTMGGVAGVVKVQATPRAVE